jgi:hypothetical protein
VALIPQGTLTSRLSVQDSVHPAALPFGTDTDPQPTYVSVGASSQVHEFPGAPAAIRLRLAVTTCAESVTRVEVPPTGHPGAVKEQIAAGATATFSPSVSGGVDRIHVELFSSP